MICCTTVAQPFVLMVIYYHIRFIVTMSLVANVLRNLLCILYNQKRNTCAICVQFFAQQHNIVLCIFKNAQIILPCIYTKSPTANSKASHRAIILIYTDPGIRLNVHLLSNLSCEVLVLLLHSLANLKTNELSDLEILVN